jgi:hypothetical protein
VDRGDELAIISDDGFPGYSVIATVALDEQPEYATNANLIAAAPELLAALKVAWKIIADSDEWWVESRFESAGIDAAIAKAEGRS